MILSPILQAYQQRMNQLLDALFAGLHPPIPSELYHALSHACCRGGKRFRPLLVYLTGVLFAVPASHLDSVATAVELIHCYSLIHDDLPAMDDDSMRRHQPACHIAFSEATAILVGDGLQALAFQQMAEDQHLLASVRLACIQRLCQAIGMQGMISGQWYDLACENQMIQLSQLENIHRLKTGALIQACVQMAALVGQANEAILQDLNDFSEALGLAYQIQDDILDLESSTQQLGKPNQSDLHKQKATYPSLMGSEHAKAYANDLFTTAIDKLRQFGSSADPLRQLIQTIRDRDH